MWSVREAVDAVFIADSAFNTLTGGRFYSESDRAQGATLPFVSYGTVNEGAFDTFNRDGNAETALIHLYGANEKVVTTMYGHVERLLNKQPLTVTGHGVRLVRTRLVSFSDDPSGAVHGVVNVSVVSQSGA